MFNCKPVIEVSFEQHVSFSSRFQVKKKQFFRNFMTIMLFGAIGTLISFVIISLGKQNNVNHFLNFNISLIHFDDIFPVLFLVRC